MREVWQWPYSTVIVIANTQLFFSLVNATQKFSALAKLAPPESNLYGHVQDFNEERPQ
jgi:hypothetical protein